MECHADLISGTIDYIMTMEKKLKLIAKSFGLEYAPETHSYILCSRGDIVIRNFLSGCADPLYRKYGNSKIPGRWKNIQKFLGSLEFAEETSVEQACVIHRSEAEKEIWIVRKIKEPGIRAGILKFYRRVSEAMDGRDYLILIYRPKKSRKVFHEVLLHEQVHKLLDNNRIWIRSWKWSEGLTTYLSFFGFGKSRFFKNKPKATGDIMLDEYYRYACKWAKVLEGAKKPAERAGIILNQVGKINKLRN